MLSIVVGAAIAVGALLLGVLLDPRRSAIAGMDGAADRRDDGDHDLGGAARPDRSAPDSSSWRSPCSPRSSVRVCRSPTPTSATTCATRWCPRGIRCRCRARSSRLKAQLAAEVEDEVVFEVESDDPADPLVDRSDDLLRRRRVDGRRPQRPGHRLPARERRASRIPTCNRCPIPTTTPRSRSDALPGPWLPVPGEARQIDFDESSSPDGSTSDDAPAPTLVQNQRSNTLAVTEGVHDGMTYTVSALAEPDRTDEELRAAIRST